LCEYSTSIVYEQKVGGLKGETRRMTKETMRMKKRERRYKENEG
jgi:hypothetical protein